MNLNCMGNSVNARLNPRSVLKPRLSREPTEQLGTRRAHFSVQSCSLWIICINASPTLTCQFAFGDDPASGPHGILGICLSVTCRVWFQRASRRKALSRHVCKCLSASERSHSPVAARQWGGFSGMHRPHQTRLDLRASKGEMRDRLCRVSKACGVFPLRTKKIYLFSDIYFDWIITNVFKPFTYFIFKSRWSK